MKSLTALLRHLQKEFEVWEDPLEDAKDEWEGIFDAELSPPPGVLSYLHKCDGITRLAEMEGAFQILALEDWETYADYVWLDPPEDQAKEPGTPQQGNPRENTSPNRNSEEKTTPFLQQNQNWDAEWEENWEEFHLIFGIEGKTGWYVLNCMQESLRFGEVYCVEGASKALWGRWKNFSDFLQGLENYCQAYPLNMYKAHPELWRHTPVYYNLHPKKEISPKNK